MGRYRQDNSGLYRINMAGKHGFMNRNGQIVIRPQFDNAADFSEGMAAVAVGNKFGFIDTAGKIVITPQFDDTLSFRYGRAPVKICCGAWTDRHEGDRYGFIDRDGKLITALNLLSVGHFSGSRSNDLAPVRFEEGGWGFVTRSGKVAIPGNFDDLTDAGFWGGTAPARRNGKWGFIDKSGKWTIDPQFEAAFNFSDGLAAVEVSGKWGFIDKRGKFVVNPQFDALFGFDNGTAAVRTGENWTQIDTKGEPVGGPAYLEFGEDCTDGFRPARTKDGWGFVKGSKLAVPPIFDTVEPFLGGLARVTIGNWEFYVDKTGAYAANPFKGRSVRPAQAAREIWEGDLTGPNWKVHERYLFVREGSRIKGFNMWDQSYPGILGSYLELTADVDADDSVRLTCENAETWKGRFLAPILIAGMRPKRKDGGPEFPFRLRYVRDATPQDFPPALPPTMSDWNAFLARFREAVAQRDVPALAATFGLTFYLPNSHLRTADDVFRQIDWQPIAKALRDGTVQEAKNPIGRPVMYIVDPRPCPGCEFQFHLGFAQDGGGQWRWIGVDYLNK